jgi:hypothetical protein
MHVHQKYCLCLYHSSSSSSSSSSSLFVFIYTSCARYLWIRYGRWVFCDHITSSIQLYLNLIHHQHICSCLFIPLCPITFELSQKSLFPSPLGLSKIDYHTEVFYTERERVHLLLSSSEPLYRYSASETPLTHSVVCFLSIFVTTVTSDTASCVIAKEGGGGYSKWKAVRLLYCALQRRGVHTKKQRRCE